MKTKEKNGILTDSRSITKQANYASAVASAPVYEMARKKTGPRYNIIALKHYYFKQIKDLPIWDLAPGEAGQTRLSKFHKVNSEACDERGVANYAAFKFSIGQLFRPVNVRATRKGWEITMIWENRENRKLSLPSDWLRVGYFYGSYPFSPRLLPDVVAKREDCQATFSIPNPGLEISEPIHLYLFFSRQDRIAFSTSYHVQL